MKSAELELAADHILVMSRIVSRKYRLIQCGIRLLSASVAAWVAAALIG
ncbi:hypothetical protein SAMN05421505_10441 [Sinosporangium album]|uniref:Pycsar effector protein domain-containing protein n=1 Tax=Sinosporangium album TaxID=504805 RepID=A0A1G7U091_9ACTN|nr:hypothetical protein SAMN05421505_10441 [Sinosporangium album]